MIPNNQYYFNNGKGAVVPSSLILTWYNSLSVKPSSGLLTALNTLADGLYADGNWDKLDLFGLLAGMETQEQQLRPLITTSGDDFVIVDTPTLDSNGVNSNGATGYLDLKWNPADDGSQFSINSAFLSSYIGSNPTPGYSVTQYCGSVDTVLNGSSFLQQTESVNVSAVINDDGSLSGPSVSNSTEIFYFAIVLDNGNSVLYKNATTNSVVFASPVLCTLDFQGASLNSDGSAAPDTSNSYLRHFMAGAGDASQSQIMTRLNTFYSARGL